MNKEVVLITGASRGVGYALAKEFAKNGYSLVLTCREKEYELIKLLDELEKYHIDTYGFVGDLKESCEVERLFGEISVAVKSGRLKEMPSIIINNAGVSYIGLTQYMDDLEWRNIIDTNLSAPFFIVRKAMPYMIKNKRGLIINISSIWGKRGASMEVAYSASKAGLENMSIALSDELELSNVDVICFRLGMIDTDMNRGFTKEDLDEIKLSLKDGKMGKPGDVAEFIVDAIMKNKYKTGDIIEVPYGWFEDGKY